MVGWRRAAAASAGLLVSASACLVVNPGFGDGEGASEASATVAATSAGASASASGSTGGTSVETGGTHGSTSAGATRGTTDVATTAVSSTSAGTTGESTTGGGGPPAICGLELGGWKLGPPTMIDFGHATSDTDPVLLADGKTLFFAGIGPGGEDSFRAERAGYGASFGPPILNDSLNSPQSDTKVSVSVDGLRAYVASGRPPALGVDFFVAARAAVEQPFGPASWLSELSSSGNDLDIHVSADELRVYFASNWDGQQDLYVAERGSVDQPFATPMKLTELNLPDSAEASPGLSADERTIFFVSTRLGSADVFVAAREDPKGPFGPPSVVSGLDGPFFQGEATLAESADGCELFYCSNAHTNGGAWNIFRAEIVAQ